MNQDNVQIPRGLVPGSLAFSAVAAAFLFWLIYGHESQTQMDLGFLSAVNAGLNACSAIALFLGYRAIKSKQPNIHRNFMLAALVFSALFLVSYIVYHTFHGDSKFLGTGPVRYLYFFILVTHVVGSVVALPLILVTFGLALSRRFSIHQKWARFTFPLWAYVSVTGVLVFMMLQYWGHT